MDITDEFNLSSSYNSAFAFYYTYINNNLNNNESLKFKEKIISIFKTQGLLESNTTDTQSTLDTLISYFMLLSSKIDSLSLISKNEEISDVPTDSIKYLFTPYILATLCSSTKDIKLRLPRLKAACIYFKQFLHSCEQMEIDIKEDLESLQKDTADSPSSIRLRKIQRAKEKKILNDKITATMEQSRKSPQDKFLLELPPFADEENARNFFISLIEYYILDSVDQIYLINQEIPLLERHLQLENTGDSVPQTEPTKPDKKIWSFKVNSLSESRDRYQNQVFQPGHRLPNISLSEFADMEMERIKQSEKYSQQSEENNLTESQKEENDLYKSREWDEWKDQNPRGIGNKNRNVG